MLLAKYSVKCPLCSEPNSRTFPEVIVDVDVAYSLAIT